ncbi:hypothetical protein Micbo1qcDRAFT_155466 [Microdochium bolleyi]|uniref:Uncharacterized protein n=1 Tax=Microdochium bolleyi TaxID=196109 RepID=A0A136JI35_9PEZI|nr:hypothetical protein Micbo1qcDRAFT_155466 [Microdochium bolleyi]
MKRKKQTACQTSHKAHPRPRTTRATQRLGLRSSTTLYTVLLFCCQTGETAILADRARVWKAQRTKQLASRVKNFTLRQRGFRLINQGGICGSCREHRDGIFPLEVIL